MRRLVLFASVVFFCCVPILALDSDGDGVDDAADCAPALRSTWAIPGEATELRAASAGRWTWLGAEQAHVYDLYRGAIPAGTPFSYTHECLQPQLLTLETVDTEDPPPGVLFYYLVGGRNGCGHGVLGFSTTSLLPNDSPCPADPEADTDGDGVPDVDDVCPGTSDPGQEDGDLDAVGNACDVCPESPDPDQSNADGDALGDACDACPNDATDTDGDGILDCTDVCAFGDDAIDADDDGVPDDCDPCPSDGTNCCPKTFLDFDGVNDYVHIPDANDLDLSGGTLTVEARIKPDTLFDNGRIVDHGGGSGGNTGWLLNVRESINGLQFMINTDPGFNDQSNPNVIALGQWNHVAVVLSGGTLTFYVNGVESGIRTGVPTPNPSSLGVRIGARVTSVTRLFNGQIDEVRLWSVARTQLDIQNNMNVHLSGSEPGLVMYQKFDEGSGQTAFDATPHGHNGRLGSTSSADTNDPLWVVADADGDGVDDVCDVCAGGDDQIDADGDDIPDFCDACPNDAQNDADGDGVCGDADNCPAVPNPDQLNGDGDAFGDACDSCPSPTSCDNGLYCDGLESCDQLLGCQAGTPPTIDDGVACTIDSCDEATDSIVHTPNHGSCDNGLFCDGAESCDVLLGCQAGTPPSVDDGVACTADSCDEATDSIVHTPNHGSCDNSLFCDGAETCDVLLGCQPGTPPSTDDGVSCTADSCDEATDAVVHSPNHGSCDNALYCDGTESCDALLGCQAGTPPAVDDGVACTIDSCDEATDSSVHTPNHGSCDNALYCDGTESCDVLLGCQVVTPPAVDDGVACTIDSCDEATDSAVHTPNHASCDNGLYCDGAETCDVLLGCQAGTPPVIDDGVACTDDSCDEATDTVVHVSHDEDLDEVCDDDDNCQSVPNADQANADGDANGDACDPCPNDPSDDVDEDGVCGDADNCPVVFNPGQEDGDANGVGDACQLPALVVISEVQYDQGGTQQEFIELYAVQGAANITGWSLSDGEAPPAGVTFTFATSDPRFPCPEPFVLGTGDHVLVFHGTGTPQCTGNDRRIFLAGTTFLQRAGDDVTLRDASSACRDYVAFENGGNATNCTWNGNPNPSNGNVENTSLSRFDGAPFDDNDLGSDWEASGATTTTGPSSPGSPNESGLADSDGDGVADASDNCPAIPNPGQGDADGDGRGNVCDNCPSAANANQADADADGLGNVCDACPNDAQNDADADGFCADVDNCPTVSNLDQADEDSDGVGDVCDPCLADPSNDVDGDGVCGAVDNCPAVANPGQADLDEDGVGDACEGIQTVDILIVDQDIRSNTPDIAQHRQQPSRRLGLRTGVLYRTLSWFDVSSIPEQANILSATLVYHTTSGDPQNINTNGDTPPTGGMIVVEVHEVLRPWNYDEPFTYPADLSDNEKDVEADETTWRYTLFPEEWEEIGATGLSDSGPAIASQTVPSLLDNQITFSSPALADAVQSWVSGSVPNHGLLLKAAELNEQSVSDNRKILCGKGFPLESSTNLPRGEAEAHRPFVRIEYELP